MPPLAALAWAKAHPSGAAAFAGAGIGLVVLARSRTKTGTAAGGAAPLGYVLPGGSNAGAAQDLLASVESQIANLAAQLQNIPTAPPGVPTPAPPSGGTWPLTGEALTPGDQAKYAAYMTIDQALRAQGESPDLARIKAVYGGVAQYYQANPGQFYLDTHPWLHG